MTEEEKKQVNLEKHQILLHALLDYYLAHHVGSMVFDNWDPAAEYYLQQKRQVEKDLQESNLDKLQLLFNRLIEGLCDRGDLQFLSHVKEKTGYDIELSEQLVKNAGVGDAIKKNVNDEVFLPESIVVQLNREQLTEKELTDLNCYLSSQPDEFNFHNCIRKLTVQTSGTDEKAITEVCIGLRGGFGCLYAVNGENLPVKAFWKDRNTVVIETKKVYKAMIRHDRVSSFQDVVNIEYIES